MGHESQIEPWLAHDQRSACWFHKSLASLQIERLSSAIFHERVLSRLTALLAVVGVTKMFGAIAFLVFGIIVSGTGRGVPDEYLN
jgi:hypothetical protein